VCGPSTLNSDQYYCSTRLEKNDVTSLGLALRELKRSDQPVQLVFQGTAREDITNNYEVKLTLSLWDSCRDCRKRNQDCQPKDALECKCPAESPWVGPK